MTTTSSSSMTEFICPITMTTFVEPVTMRCGHSFEKSAILQVLTMNGTPLCPTCRSPLDRSMPSINYTLKALVENMRSASAPASASAPQAVSENPNRPTVSAKRVIGTNKIHIQVRTEGTMDTVVPVDYYFLNDRSGSMSERAAKASTVSSTSDDVADAAEFSRNQLTDFALNVCNIMDEKHRMGIVVFDTAADVILQPTQMNDAGKAIVKQKMPLPVPRGGTDYWVGIRTTLELMKQNYRPGALSVIFLLTDGATDSTRIPAGGFRAAIEDWKEENPTIKFMINTIGFGYGPSVDMKSLSSIARAAGGTVSYIPDGGFVCPVFTHLVANLGSCQHVDQYLMLEPAQGVRLSNTVFSVKMLQAGQARDFYVGATTPPPAGEPGMLLTATIAGETFIFNQDIPTELPDGLFLRDALVGILEKSIDARTMDMTAFTAAMLLVQNKDALFEAIMEDFASDDPNKGQIEKSFRPTNWSVWGYHYILSILDGYRLQIRVNDKDAVGALYKAPHTEALIRSGTRLLRTLTLPEGTYSARSQSAQYGGSSQPVYAPRAMTLGVSQGCFTGDGMALMNDGSRKRIDAIQKGDIMHDNHRVLCVLKTLTGGKAHIVRLGSSGGWTPNHPVRINGDWFLPGDMALEVIEECEAVYNFVMESGHFLIIGDTMTCTIGHDWTGPVIGHPYFGKREPNVHNMLDDLEASTNYDSGLVIWSDVSVQRDAQGYVCKMTPGFQS